MSLPFLLLFGGTTSVAVATQTQVELFAGQSQPTAVTTQTYVEVFGPVPSDAVVTQTYVEVFGRRGFEDPCAIHTPIFWTAIADENANVFLAATRACRDAATYYGGYKPARLLNAGNVTRAATDWLTRACPVQSDRSDPAGYESRTAVHVFDFR